MVEGTTIESTVYNGYTADITIDLNTPRPISSGGTGANNAADAMAALGGEGSKIEVTNYDSHAFTAGSFYSKASASNPPIAGHAFAGICYVAVVSGVATSDMFIEVRDRDEATQPGSLFVRQKKNGTWSGWLKAVGTTTGATPPTAPTDGMLWWDPTQGKLFIWYSDPNTAQWVEAVATPDLGPDDFVSVDVAQNFTEAEKKTARSNIYAAPFDALAYNGMQINGSMEVGQERGFSAPVIAGYVADGWRYDVVGSSIVNAAQSPVAYPGFSAVLTISPQTPQVSMGAGDVCFLTQYIEGYRISRLAWGQASAQPITVGFWSAHTKTGTYSIAVRNHAANRSYVASYTQNVSAGLEYKTITIPGDVAGTWETGNTRGIQLHFCVAAGANFIAPATGVWNAVSYVAAPGQVNSVSSISDIFRLTGVVVLPGIEAPSAARSPLIMRPYDQELVTCQRYYNSFGGNIATELVGSGMAYNAGAAEIYVSYPTMRAAPTTAYNGAFALVVSSTGLTAITTISAAGSTTPKGAVYLVSGGSGLVTGNATMLMINSDITARFKLDARL